MRKENLKRRKRGWARKRGSWLQQQTMGRGPRERVTNKSERIN